MLFDNNYGFDMNFMGTNNLTNYDDKVNILNPYDSFLRGNSFKNEYNSYKNYNYKKLNPTSNKEKLLYEIMSLCFIINDLNLYLDLHSEDNDTFTLFKKYIEEEKVLEEKYTKEYGPLALNDITDSKYTWLGNMPWENIRGDMYV